MTASPGREVHGNLLRGAAPGSAEARAKPQDAGGQNLGDLVDAFEGGHVVRVERDRHHSTSAETMNTLTRLHTQATGQMSGCIDGPAGLMV
jgi:hypothetical protein